MHYIVCKCLYIMGACRCASGQKPGKYVMRFDICVELKSSFHINYLRHPKIRNFCYDFILHQCSCHTKNR